MLVLVNLFNPGNKFMLLVHYPKCYVTNFDQKIKKLDSIKKSNE